MGYFFFMKLSKHVYLIARFSHINNTIGIHKREFPLIISIINKILCTITIPTFILILFIFLYLSDYTPHAGAITKNNAPTGDVSSVMEEETIYYSIVIYAATLLLPSPIIDLNMIKRLGSKLLMVSIMENAFSTLIASLYCLFAVKASKTSQIDATLDSKGISFPLK